MPFLKADKFFKIPWVSTGILFLFLLGTSLAHVSKKTPITKIDDQSAAHALLGKHPFSLQWISWKHFGKVIIVNQKGNYIIKGHQTEGGDGDMASAKRAMSMEGTITHIGTHSFTVDGSLMIHLNHLNKAQPCWRKGKMKFVVQRRKFHSWRLEEKQNPCGAYLDYVDIHVDRDWQPHRAVKREPAEAGNWGIGIIMKETSSLQPGMLIFPDSPIPLYNSPDGKPLGSAKADPQQWKFDLIHKGTTTEIPQKGHDLREIGYETSAVTVYSQKKGYLEVFRQGKRKGAWLKSSDLEKHGFKFSSWINFLLTQKEVPFYPRTPLTVRNKPGTQHKKVTSLKDELVDVLPTGKNQDAWLEVEVLRYSVHPCVDGKGKISKKWKGWIKFVDDAGFPNVWYPTRGC